MNSNLTAEEVCSLLCEGWRAVVALGGDGNSARSLHVDRGDVFGLELARLLCSRGWTECANYSPCSVATFECVLMDPNGSGQGVAITSSVFMGPFTIIEPRNGPLERLTLTERAHENAREPLPLDAPPPGARKRKGRARASR